MKVDQCASRRDRCPGAWSDSHAARGG